ncbi:MAG TPA: serine/threonine-protein kinase [Ramlibacter sp.]|nr:serine/threonine-protein kinase [Ramlibacter sp.]
MPAASPPAHIGKYQVLRELGRGASSTVYLAEDPFNGREVAIKRVHAQLLADEEQARRYRRSLRTESLLAGKLQHPHIVSVLDADGQADPPYVVLEYVEGTSLLRYTRPGRLLPVEHVLDIVYKCCSALEYARGLGLVHRDVKPANLMIKNDGEVKLTDFGTAASAGGATGGTITQLSGLVGSPNYMAPEQVREEPCTFRSDMFSLAVVAYELLTGRRPFEGESDYATMWKVGHEEPPPPSALRPELPAELDDVLLLAMAKRPEHRYAEWMDFAEALLDIKRGLPTGRASYRDGEAWSRMRRLPFFAGFPDAALWEVLQLGTLATHPRGSLLMREGATGSSFLVLLEGKVGVLRGGVRVATLEPGVTIGEMAYLRRSGAKRTASAVADTPVLALEVRNDDLRKAPDALQGCFDKAFIELLLNRLMATTEKLGLQATA